MPLSRFLKYISFDTQSDASVERCPTTPSQRIFAQHLADELAGMEGVEEITLDENGYLTAVLPATINGVPPIGFIAHLDTSPDCSGANVNARVVQYHGGEIVLNAEHDTRLSPTESPELENYRGQEIVVTDGTTLLGADDKAGVAAIMSAVDELRHLQHGRIAIAFTPDEEIGRGADRFPLDRFACEWAYTIDGGEIGELEYENFNAAEATVSFAGKSYHPGYAKGRMVNAMELAHQWHAMLPDNEKPEHTEGYEGFFHLTHIEGNIEQARLKYIIRDHNATHFEERLALMEEITAKMLQRYPQSSTLSIRHQYRNMLETITPHPEVIELAKEAMETVGVTPLIRAIRGGTDGAQLSFKGLPCPNLFAGGHNFHGRYEYLPVASLIKAKEVVVAIAQRLAQLHDR